MITTKEKKANKIKMKEDQKKPETKKFVKAKKIILQNNLEDDAMVRLASQREEVKQKEEKKDSEIKEKPEKRQEKSVIVKKSQN